MHVPAVAIIFIFYHVQIGFSEVFTALSEMESLIEVELQLLTNLKSFVGNEEGRIHKLRG